MAQIEQRPNYCDFTTDLRYVKSGNKFLLPIEKLIEGRPINTSTPKRSMPWNICPIRHGSCSRFCYLGYGILVSKTIK